MESGALGSNAGSLVDHFFRHEYGRLVATLMRAFPSAGLETIEDAVQTALAKALSTWRRDGLPDNPSAWLTSVARNTVLDAFRRQKTVNNASSDLADAALQELPEPRTPYSPSEIEDDQLRMLFVCCDDELSSQSQLVLALKLLCGFSTREIATRLFTNEENVQKQLSRGRARLKEVWSLRPEWADSPALPQILSRTETVLSVIYLLFNEGYSSLEHHAPIRQELCEEALRLGRLVTQHPATATPEAWALLALMEMHAARLASRRNGQGGLLMLEQQDRTLWDRAGIQRGFVCLARAAEGDNFSRYHAEAAVVAEHCIAPTFEQTRWGEIVALYEMLDARQPSAIHTLNRAIALAEWKGPEAGLELLAQCEPPRWLAGYYLWDATHGELLRRASAFEEARRYLDRAIESAPTQAERHIFEQKRARCDNRDATR